MDSATAFSEDGMRDNMIKLSAILSMLVVQSLQQQQIDPLKEQETNEYHRILAANRWQWDHNHHDIARPLNAFYNSSAGLPGESTHFSLRHLLIVQDSAPGPGEEVLKATSRVNRAYAKRWGYDYLKFTGVAMGNSPWQATFNKPFLLSSLMQGNPGLLTDGTEGGSPMYDTVMFLDASAIIVELDFNILHLIGKDKLLASGWEPSATRNSMYSDVMIWNLNHPQAKNVSA